MLVTTKVPFGLVLLIKSKIYDEEIKASDQGSLVASCLVVCAIKSLWLLKKKKKRKVVLINVKTSSSLLPVPVAALHSS